MNHSFNFTWLGNAGLQFENQQSTLLVDPFLSRPHWRYLLGGCPLPDERRIQEHISHADYILVTHAHYDHLMDVPIIARHTDAKVIGSNNTRQICEMHGVPVKQVRMIHAGEWMELPGLRIQAIAAQHPWLPFYTPGKLKNGLKPPLRLDQYRMDDCFSFTIQNDDTRLFVCSSISTRGAVPADILFIRAVAGEAWYREMLSTVKPRVVVPTHWDDMFRPLDQPVRPFFAPPRLAIPPLQRIDLDEFTRKINRVHQNCRVLLPEIFCEYDLSDWLR